jgi:hypothetical protein
MKNVLRSVFVTISTCAAFSAHAQDPSAVERHVVSRDNVDIEVLSQGSGPVLVLLPSLGRSGEDYDAVAVMLASQGFRVLRPQPRGIGRSKGPMDGSRGGDARETVTMPRPKPSSPNCGRSACSHLAGRVIEDHGCNTLLFHLDPQGSRWSSSRA